MGQRDRLGPMYRAFGGALRVEAMREEQYEALVGRLGSALSDLQITEADERVIHVVAGAVCALVQDCAVATPAERNQDQGAGANEQSVDR